MMPSPFLVVINNILLLFYKQCNNKKVFLQYKKRRKWMNDIRVLKAKVNVEVRMLVL